VRLGLRANLAQFILLVAVNALVGGMLGQERTVLPLLATDEFGLRAYTAALTYILAFGLAKAITNYFAGTFSDRFGRKPILVAGWLVAIPVPVLLIVAPSWAWVVAANVLLGISQGLTWSLTVIMKIDLVGPARRGFAMGMNEAAGYVAVAATALTTGYLAQAYGLRPAPFLLGLAFAALGLGLSTVAVRETREYARLEAARHTPRGDGKHDHLHADLTNAQVFEQTSVKEPALSAASQAGMVQARGQAVPGAVRRRGTVHRADRHPGRALPAGVGRRPAGYRSPLRPVGPQVAHRRRNGAPGARAGPGRRTHWPTTTSPSC
jgi:MFS family permease